MRTHNDFIKILKSNMSQSYWDKINSELTLHGFKSPSSKPMQFLRLALDNPEAFKENYLKSCRTSRSITPTINAWENMVNIPQIKDALKESHGPLLTALKEFQKTIIALLEEKEKKSKRNTNQTQTEPVTGDDLQEIINVIQPMTSPPEHLETTAFMEPQQHTDLESDVQPSQQPVQPQTSHMPQDVPGFRNKSILLFYLQNMKSKFDTFATLYDDPTIKTIIEVMHKDINVLDHLLQN